MKRSGIRVCMRQPMRSRFRPSFSSSSGPRRPHPREHVSDINPPYVCVARPARKDEIVRQPKVKEVEHNDWNSLLGADILAFPGPENGTKSLMTFVRSAKHSTSDESLDKCSEMPAGYLKAILNENTNIVFCPGVVP